MRGRGGIRLIGVAAATLATVLLARPLIHWFETPRSLSQLLVLAHESRNNPEKQKLAERELRQFLARRPDSREANLIMANLLVDRQNPKPATALEHLKRIRSRDAKTRAAVLVVQGKAEYQLSRLRAAEAAWLEAMKLDPTVPEAGWLLIQLYYLQGRNNLCRELALSLFPREYDSVDRVRYLLELVREDVERLAPAGVIPWLEPAVKNDPDDRASVLALGRARVREGQGDEGFALLRRAVEQAPNDPRGWEIFLSGLNDEGNVDELERQLGRLPSSLASDRRFALFRGRVAQERGAFADAATAYRAYLEVFPNDVKTLHRLARVLRLAGRDDEAPPIEQREAALTAASRELKETYERVNTAKFAPTVNDYQAFASIRERQGIRDEALAWHRLVLLGEPENVESRLAVTRLTRSDPDATPAPRS